MTRNSNLIEQAAAGLTHAELDRLLSIHRARQRPPANWAYWRHVPKAELWQCVALSLGVEPTDDMCAVGPSLHGTGARPWFHGDKRDDLRFRLKIAVANVGFDKVSALRPVGQLGQSPERNLFLLRAFGQWARGAFPGSVAVDLPDDAEAPGSATKAADHDHLQADPHSTPPVVLTESSGLAPSALGETLHGIRRHSGAAIAVGDTGSLTALPAGVSTDDLAIALHDLHFSSASWRTNLQDYKTKWIVEAKARMSEGLKGGHNHRQATWNPCAIGGALLLRCQGWKRTVPDFNVRRRQLDERFAQRSELRAWHPAWKEQCSKWPGE